MIFCTIGTQAPFDRFVKIIDEVAAHLDEEIIAQVYKSEYVAQNIRTVEFLPPDEFNKLFSKARLIVAHAGMGTIISAMRQHKPIIIFPRIAAEDERTRLCVRGNRRKRTKRAVDNPKFKTLA